MTTPLAAERLEEIRAINAKAREGLSEAELRVGYQGQREYDLLSHIDFLTSPVRDEEVEKYATWLQHLATKGGKGSADGDARSFGTAAGVLRRLAREVKDGALETMDWRQRTDPTPSQRKIWVTNGTDIWMLTGDGKPFDDRATACQLWCLARLPALPNGTPADNLED